MKKFIFLAAAALWLPTSAPAGEIIPGSVPGNISYQGRLERDNAPITGPVHLHFRLYNSLAATGGNCLTGVAPCLWESPEITVQAAQGIFSADLTPPIAIFTGGQKLYIEVQVESDVLSPREPLNSVAYAYVAKKLEDGSAVIVTSITAGYQVYLATNTGASVGIGGTIKPGTKLTVDGDIEMINGGVIRYPDGSSQPSALIGGVVGGITSSADATIVANTDSSLPGDNILFGLPNVVGAGEKMRITNAGLVGIGTPVPMGKLDVNGSLYVGNEGITDRTLDGEVNIKGDLLVEGGKVTGSNSESISLGETDNIIAFAINGAEKARIHSNNFFGVGITPASMIHSGADIAAEGGVRAGRVSVGGYSPWAGQPNEVKAQSGYNLLLQQTNSYNVGIGTDTPREKLHVRGSIRSDYGIIAATGAFSGDVSVTGDFRALGSYKEVFLTSTTIYGDSRIYGKLFVSGGIGSDAGDPAYKASSQTFTGTNAFLGQITVSSDVASSNRLGAGVLDFDFPGSKYLQVGDNKPEFAYNNSLVYLVAGSSAEAKIGFYRGALAASPVEMARLETQSGNILPNLALVVNNQVKTLTDSTYHRIQNSVVWISTGYAGTPTIFASSSSAIVGIGTTVSDPNWRLTVAGNMRISGSGNGIFFPDGTSLTSGNLGALSVGNLSNNGDAVVQSDADQSGGGDVILRAGAVDGLVVKSGGNIGIGTINPVAKLNIRGGDLVLGTPINPYGADSVEDLIVGGNIVFDGELLQRSASQVKLSGLLVGGDVYLSTGTGKRTGIGTESPLQRLQVAGDINIESGSGIRINNTAASTNYLRGDGTRFVSSAIQDGDIPATIVRTSRSITTTLPLAGGNDLSANRTFSVGGLSSLGTGNYVVGVNAGAGAWEYKNIVGVANETDVTHGAGTITIGIIDPLIVSKGGTGLSALTQGDLVYGSAANTMSALAKDTNATRYLSNTGAGNAPAWDQVELTNGVSGILPSANGGTGANLSAGAIGAVPYFTATGVMGTIPTTSAGTADTLVRRDGSGNFSGNVITANSFSGTIAGGSSFIKDTVGGNDYIRVMGGGLGNAGWLEIATADDGTEPIYVRQYSDAAMTVVTRTATLLDGSGNTSFPGSVTAGVYSYAQDFNMTANVVASNPEYLVGEWGADKFLRYVLPSDVTVGRATTVTTNANLTGPVTSAGNATAIANGAIGNAMLANGAVANLLGTNSGDETAAGIRLKIGAASAGNDGYLSQANWSTFNGKQAAGNYITALTGDVTASGPNSVAATIANGAVTLAKMASMATNSFIARDTGGIGAPEVLSVAAVKTLLNLAGTNNGDQTTITGNAGTATSLVANGSDCSAGSYPLGVDASGNVENCTSLGTAQINRAVCWKTATALGYCSTVVAADGSCTCN